MENEYTYKGRNQETQGALAPLPPSFHEFLGRVCPESVCCLVLYAFYVDDVHYNGVTDRWKSEEYYHQPRDFMKYSFSGVFLDVDSKSGC